jgi:hypothetical protein
VLFTHSPFGGESHECSSRFLESIALAAMLALGVAAAAHALTKLATPELSGRCAATNTVVRSERSLIL